MEYFWIYSSKFRVHLFQTFYQVLLNLIFYDVEPKWLIHYGISFLHLRNYGRFYWWYWSNWLEGGFYCPLFYYHVFWWVFYSLYSLMKCYRVDCSNPILMKDYHCITNHYYKWWRHFWYWDNMNRVHFYTTDLNLWIEATFILSIFKDRSRKWAIFDFLFVI